MKEFLKKLVSSKKRLAVLIAAVLVLTVVVGGSLAYLTSIGDMVTNNFHAGEGDVQISENLDGGSKSDIRLTNLGNIPVFVRAAVIANWVDPQGNVIAAPVSLPSSLGSNWHLYEGYYYYSKTLAPAGEGSRVYTTALFQKAIKEADMTKPSADAHLQVTVLAESIQAEGTTNSSSTGTKAVVEAWGLDPSKF